MAVTVLNPHCWPRSDVAATGRIYPAAGGRQERRRAATARAASCRRSSSESPRSRHDELVVAEVAFRASEVPSAGYDTYYLEFDKGEAARGSEKAGDGFED